MSCQANTTAVATMDDADLNHVKTYVAALVPLLEVDRIHLDKFSHQGTRKDLWRGFRLKTIDARCVQAHDTAKSQAVYPQPSRGFHPTGEAVSELSGVVGIDP